MGSYNGLGTMVSGRHKPLCCYDDIPPLLKSELFLPSKETQNIPSCKKALTNNRLREVKDIRGDDERILRVCNALIPPLPPLLEREKSGSLGP